MNTDWVGVIIFVLVAIFLALMVGSRDNMPLCDVACDENGAEVKYTAHCFENPSRYGIWKLQSRDGKRVITTNQCRMTEK